MFLNKLKLFIKLLRPEISIMDLTLTTVSICLALYTMIYNHTHFINLSYLIIPIIGGFCAITSSYIFNDCIDIDVDSINLPKRPLPSGNISKKAALKYGSLLILFSSIIAFFFNFQTIFILFFAFLLIMLYSSYFKRKTVLSFIFVGFSYGLVPIGIWISINPLNIYYLEHFSDISFIPFFCFIFGLMICITDFGFSLAGVCRDIFGDFKKKIPTLPVTYGISFSSKIITLCWIIGILISVILG